METIYRFTLIFAGACHESGAEYCAALARLVPDHCILAFTVWPSDGYVRSYGRETGATVEFIAPLRRAVEFGADVAKHYGQECTYLACGDAAVLVGDCGRIIEVLTTDAVFAGANVERFNVTTEILDNTEETFDSEGYSLISGLRPR